MQQCKHEVYRDKRSFNYNILAKSVITSDDTVISKKGGFLLIIRRIQLVNMHVCFVNRG